MEQQDAGRCAVEEVGGADKVGCRADKCEDGGGDREGADHDDSPAKVVGKRCYDSIIVTMLFGNYRSIVRGFVGGWLVAPFLLYSYDKCRLRPMAISYRAQ